MSFREEMYAQGKVRSLQCVALLEEIAASPRKFFDLAGLEDEYPSDEHAEAWFSMLAPEMRQRIEEFEQRRGEGQKDV